MKIVMLFITLVIFYMIPVHNCFAKKCKGLDPFKICQWDISRETVPLNETELIQFCERLRNYYECVDELPNILRPNEFCGMAEVLREAKPVLDELCTVGGRLFTRYKLYGSCFGYVPQFYNQAYSTARKMAEIYLKITNDKESAKKLKTCYAGTRFLHDLMMRIKLQCDLETSELYDELHHRTYIYLLYCRDYEEYSIANVAIADTFNALLKGAAHDETFPGVVVYTPMLDDNFKIRKLKRTEF